MSVLDEFSPATGTGGGAPIRIADNSGRAKTIILVLWIILGITVISLISNVLQYFLLTDFALGNVDESAANSNDMRQGLVALAQLVLIIVSAVFFIMWFRRAYNNLHSIKASGLSCTEGWAAGAWFVPFLNLVRPYVIMREIWEITQQYTLGKTVKEQTSLLGWWWGIWITSNFVSQAASRLQMRAEDIDSLLISTIVYIISDVIEIVSVFVTVALIKKVSAVETEFKQSYIGA